MDHNNNECITEIIHKRAVHCKVATVPSKQGAFNTTDGNLSGKFIESQLLVYQHSSLREVLFVVVNYRIYSAAF
jgi:hypothetical protein